MDLAASQNFSIFFQKVAGPDWLRRIGHLRSLVWKHEGVRVPDFDGGNPDIWLDELDATAHHWVALHGRRLIAAGRFTLHDSFKGMPDENWFQEFTAMKGPIASFNRLVVLKAYRNYGIGRRLDHLRSWDAIEQDSASIVAVAVGDHRRDALEAIGFNLTFQFPTGHGLIVPERPLYAMTALANDLSRHLPEVSTQLHIEKAQENSVLTHELANRRTL